MKVRALALFLFLFFMAGSAVSYAELFTLPGVIPPSACRTGAVLSTDQFTTTGFSNVRTANPNDEIVAGDWVVANDYVSDTSVILPPNCEHFASTDSDTGMNLMAVRLKPTISSAADANITLIKLAWDVNVNGLWDPLLDLVLQTKPGSDLDSPAGAVFFNGPQNPLAFLVNSDDDGPLGDHACFIGADDEGEEIGVGPNNGTNSTGADTDGCYIALLAVVVIGDSPKTGSQFGLSLEALAGDIPGTNGISSYTFSSG
ncbi:hypothetical protein HY229_02765, partial [Candidatus Acetothermia bacterium]|nr:hypothetical protein [Candidatus Acetothermia bacterium]MBI3643004.1 hypothetical protein [Candidatus Acetothermia bacterium]